MRYSTERARGTTSRGIAALLATALAVVVLLGCGSSITGGSIPPGDIDIVGYVLEAVGLAGVPLAFTQGGDPWPPQGTPIPGCTVYLYRGGVVVDTTTTDPEGRFEFQSEATGDYDVVVQPPAGSGFAEGRQAFQHRHGEQTRLVLRLMHAAGSGAQVALVFGALWESRSPDVRS